MEPNAIVKEFFIVKSGDGKYFRAKGYGGGGQSWVDEINKARIYNTIGPARSVVTWFRKHHPSYPIADIVRMRVTYENVEVLVEERERVEKRIQKAKEKERKVEDKNTKKMKKNLNA